MPRATRSLAYGRKDVALANYVQSFRLNPNSAAVDNNRASLWKRKGDDQRAHADYAAARAEGKK